MPAHAAPRTALVSRPRTVLALSLVVATLTTAALVQSQQPARAAQVQVVSTAPVTAPVTAAGLAPSLVEIESSRTARIVADLAERERRRERAEGRERKEERRRRQERRAEARAEARSERRADAWTLPVPGAGWSASFGESGSAWSSGYHTGQDFTAPSGTPVHAVGPGTITSAAYDGAYGNLTVITHPDGSESWYAHLSGFERTSGSVAAGDVIGYVGCTGNCYGNHVHLEYHPGGGDAADPLPWLRGHGA